MGRCRCRHAMRATDRDDGNGGYPPQNDILAEKQPKYCKQAAPGRHVEAEAIVYRAAFKPRIGLTLFPSDEMIEEQGPLAGRTQADGLEKPRSAKVVALSAIAPPSVKCVRGYLWSVHPRNPTADTCL